MEEGVARTARLRIRKTARKTAEEFGRDGLRKEGPWGWCVGGGGVARGSDRSEAADTKSCYRTHAQ